MSAKLDGEFREFMHARWPAMVRLIDRKSVV